MVALFAGYPLWWLLGVTEIVSVLLCLVMLQMVLARGPVRLPPSFWVWALFLAWVAVGVLVVQVDAPGAVAGYNPARYLTWSYRLLWYLRGTIVLVFVGNLLATGALQRISRALSWMFIWTVVGGLLGAAFAHVSFPSLLEVLLPHQLFGNAFVQSLVHPRFAEVQRVLGGENGRPSAPFPFANIWGLNFACFLPFFVHGWLGPGAGRRRWLAVPLLAVSVVPVVLSLNRALWLSLILVGVVLAVRSAGFGHPRAVLALLGAGALVAVTLLATPLGTVIQDRLSGPNSNQSRTHLATLGVRAMSTTSPVIGLGTTRDVQGSFTSIATGSTAACPHCSPPALGTQGQLSLINFTQGWGGTLLYLGFIGLFVVRSVRVRSPEVTIGLAVLLLHLVTTPVYSADNLALLAIMTAVALLWRAQPTSARIGATLGGSLSFLARHAPVIALTTLAGCAVGAAWQAHDGTPYRATVSLLLPAAPGYPGTLGPPRTLDTEAQLARTSAVTDAVAKAAPRAVNEGGAALRVTITTNTRILNLSFTAADRAATLRAVDAAATALLAQRSSELLAERKLAISTLDDRSTSLTRALNTIDAADAAIEASNTDHRAQKRLISRQRYLVLASIAQLSSQTARVNSLPVTAGNVLAQPVTQPARGSRFVRPGSGLVLGLALGVGLAGLLERLIGWRIGGNPGAANDVDLQRKGILWKLTPRWTVTAPRSPGSSAVTRSSSSWSPWSRRWRRPVSRTG